MFYYVFAIFSYLSGFHLIPQQIDSSTAQILHLLYLIQYFIALPLLYWRLLIVAGSAKMWKLIIVFSLSATAARYSFAPAIASYFDFIVWIKYPLIGILLIFELAIMWHVISGLWKARHLKGDPRIHNVKSIEELDEKKRRMQIMMSYEPSSWYYAIKWFSRDHPEAIAKLMLKSSSAYFLALLLISLCLTASLAYWALREYSLSGAVFAAGFILYGAVLIIANYRISRHYSCYLQEDNLIINASFFTFAVVPLSSISKVSLLHTQKEKSEDATFLGASNNANIELILSKPIFVHSAMGFASQPYSTLILAVDAPERFKSIIETDQQHINGCK